MNTMTRQDLQAVTEVAKNKIIERLVTKYDVQAACDNARDRILSSLQAYQLENQALIRNANASRDTEWRKISALESQISSLQHEIRALHQVIDRFMEFEKAKTQFQPKPRFTLG